MEYRNAKILITKLKLFDDLSVHIVSLYYQFILSVYVIKTVKSKTEQEKVPQTMQTRI